MTERGYIPDDSSVLADVAHAQATADNARQMVLNRDPRLNSLDDAVAASDVIHAAINQRITALEQIVALSVKQIEYRDAVPVPAIAIVVISASVDVSVTWATPFPDTDYVILKPAVTSASVTLLGKTDAVVKSKTVTGCVVTVTTTAVLGVGAVTLSVLAYKRNS